MSGNQLIVREALKSFCYVMLINIPLHIINHAIQSRVREATVITSSLYLIETNRMRSGPGALHWCLVRFGGFVQHKILNILFCLWLKMEHSNPNQMYKGNTQGCRKVLSMIDA